MMFDTDNLIPEDAERLTLTLTREKPGAYTGVTCHVSKTFEELCDEINAKAGFDEIVEVVVIRRAVVKRTAFAADAPVVLPPVAEEVPF